LKIDNYALNNIEKNKIIASKVKDCRKKAGITQKKLSEMIDKSIATVRKYEQGSRNMNLETLISIANALDVPITYFTDEAGVDLYNDLISEAVKRDPSLKEDPEKIKDKISKEMTDRELLLSLAYSELSQSIETEKNIANYLLSKSDIELIRNAVFTDRECIQLIDFLVIVSTAKGYDILKHRNKSDNK